MLDTDQLRSFLAIVDTGAFAKAAERVNKTQSAVSMHVRRLEERLGIALFAKQGRRSRLTEEGERLVEHARAILRAEAGALAALSRKGLRGAVRLGMPDDYADAFLAEVLGRFAPRHPLVEVTAVCDGSVDIARQVAARDLDLALVTEHEGLTGFEALREGRLVFAVAKGFKRVEGAPLPLALGSPSCLWRRMAESALAEGANSTRLMFQSRNFSAVATVVRAGLAATVLAESVVGPEFRVLRPEEGATPLPRSRMGLIFAPGRVTAEAQALAQAIRGAVGGAERRRAA